MTERILIPDYYRKFHCAGSSCPDTCCKGWEISIDKKTMRKYRELKKKGFDFHGAVGDKRLVMKNGVCPLLENGVCRLHRDLGEEYLCRTCRLYPRHDEDYGRVHERSLSLSCPEAARLILTEENGFNFREYTGKKKRAESRNADKEDPSSRPLFSKVMEARRQMLSILFEKGFSLEERMAMILAMAHDIQRRLEKKEEREEGQIEEVIKRYGLLRSGTGREYFLAKLGIFQNRREERYDLMASFLGLLERFSDIYPGYGAKVSEWMDVLYRTDAGFPDYDRALSFAEKAKLQMERAFENLTAYFLCLYVPGAVYDRDVYTKVKFSLFSVLCIREALTAEEEIRRKGKETPEKREAFELLCRLAWTYSRQTEHSDENLNLAEKALKKEKQFSMEAFLINLLN